MREYKFRAWDKTREEMINVDMLLNTENGIQQYRVTRPLVNGCLDVEFVKEDTILMQYTGLKDRNGVEIYEGDIVKYEDGTISEVVFDKYMLSYRTKIGYLIGMFEVIGNIYENPELLN